MADVTMFKFLDELDYQPESSCFFQQITNEIIEREAKLQNLSENDDKREKLKIEYALAMKDVMKVQIEAVEKERGILKRSMERMKFSYFHTEMMIQIITRTNAGQFFVEKDSVTGALRESMDKMRNYMIHTKKELMDVEAYLGEMKKHKTTLNKDIESIKQHCDEAQKVKQSSL